MKKQTGFALIASIAGFVVIAAIVVAGVLVYRHNHKSNPANSNSQQTANKPTTNTKTQSQASDPYAGWKTYLDRGTTPTSGSGVSVRYPSDWQVSSGDSRAYAWELRQETSPMEVIGVRYVYLDNSYTPEQEWTNCPSADACGPFPNSVKLSDSSSTINSLEAYNVKMQRDAGVYSATVIKSNQSTSAGTAFVEFILDSNDANQLSTYNRIVASATFPNP